LVCLVLSWWWVGGVYFLLGFFGSLFFSFLFFSIGSGVLAFGSCVGCGGGGGE
jgi:hypothetical protein